MVDTGKTKLSRGQHLKRKETKVEILKYVLNSDSSVPEPNIREHLTKTFGTRDTKTMKVHFEDLRKFECMKKMAKSGLDNKWEIDSLKHLEKIKEKFVKEIKLNCHKKAINIVLAKFTGVKSLMVDFGSLYGGEDMLILADLFPITEEDFFNFPVSINENSFREYLEASPTFFEMCMYTDIEILFDRWISLSTLADDYLIFYTDHKTRLGMSKDEALRDFYIKELPFLAFSHCVYMDVLKGENKTSKTDALIKIKYMEIIAGYP
jgi:hypothetical protein